MNTISCVTQQLFARLTPFAIAYIIAVKVIDIFGNDTMTLVPVNIS